MSRAWFFGVLAASDDPLINQEPSAKNKKLKTGMLKRYSAIALFLVLPAGLGTAGCERAEGDGAAPLETVAPADTTQRRYVDGNTFISTYLPPLRIEVDEAMTYVGAIDFILKEIAQVERHVFVQADAQQRIERMVIFQFEGFLETTDDYYRYRFTNPDTLGGLAFRHNTWYYDDAAQIANNPEAESARTRAFLEAKGYSLDAELMMSRFVAVVDEAKRHELILFYWENVRDTGLTLAELATSDGDIQPQHAALDAALKQRSLQALTVFRYP